MQPTQSSNPNPTIQYRTPDGQTVTGPLNEAPPQVQLLYQQLPQSTAQTSTAQSGAVSAAAGANVAQVNAQKAPATIDLGKDLNSNKIGLSAALKKYTPLGMSADDVFKQYLSTRGMPNLSPTELQNMGVTTGALGAIGDNGSYADRWNTAANIKGLRDLQDKFHKTGSFSHLVNKLGLANLGFDTTAANAQAGFESARNLYTEHLSTLVPGGSNASGDIAKITSSIPVSTDVREYSPGKADSQFNSAEDQLLKMKGYTYKDLGLGAPPGLEEHTGGGVLKSLMGGIINPPLDAAKKTNIATASPGSIPESQRYHNPLMAILGGAQDTANFAKNTVLNPAIVGEAALLSGGPDLVGGVAAAPEVLGKILGKGATKEVAGMSTNPLMDFIAPGKAIAKAGEFRDQLVQDATKAGNSADAKAIISDLENSVSKLKRGNLGQGDIIDRSIEDAKGAFKGKVTAQELADAYREADNGFTKAGVAKSSIQSNIDRNLRDILAKHLDDVAPGWDEATQAMAKGYKTADSSTRKIAKRIGIGAASTGLSIAGYEKLRRVLDLH